MGGERLISRDVTQRDILQLVDSFLEDVSPGPEFICERGTPVQECIVILLKLKQIAMTIVERFPNVPAEKRGAVIQAFGKLTREAERLYKKTGRVDLIEGLERLRRQ